MKIENFCKRSIFFRKYFLAVLFFVVSSCNIVQSITYENLCSENGARSTPSDFVKECRASNAPHIAQRGSTSLLFKKEVVETYSYKTGINKLQKVLLNQAQIQPQKIFPKWKGVTLVAETTGNEVDENIKVTVSQLSNYDIQVFIDLLKEFDSNLSGVLEWKEIQKCLEKYLGNVPKNSKAIIREIALQFDEDFNGLWDLAEFLAFITVVKGGTFKKQLGTFVAYDTESKGYITKLQAKQALLDIYKNVLKYYKIDEFFLPFLNEIDARSLIDDDLIKAKLKAADSNKNNKIEFHEFQYFYAGEQEETEAAFTFKVIDQNSDDKLSKKELVEAYSDQFHVEALQDFDMEQNMNYYLQMFATIQDLYEVGKTKEANEALEDYKATALVKSNEELATMYNSLDKDKNGVIDYHEFRNYFINSALNAEANSLIITQ